MEVTHKVEVYTQFWWFLLALFFAFANNFTNAKLQLLPNKIAISLLCAVFHNKEDLLLLTAYQPLRYLKNINTYTFIIDFKMCV